MGAISDRRALSAARFGEIKDRLGDAEKIAKGKACVYVTGSFGRREASEHSDLDLFFAGKNDDEDEGSPKGTKLRRLDEILIKADLIEISRELKFPEFSGDGKYLTSYSVDQLTKTLGTPDDDGTNTFTARLLLLLESTPLIESTVYDEVIDDVIAAYWRDYEAHKSNFVPAFIANDILRLWRTFCVNYEAGTERAPESKKAKGKLKNYKLKHSRLLTCYSALLWLLATFKKNGTVAPNDAVGMTRMSPTERLEWLASSLPETKTSVAKLQEHYEAFLSVTNASEKELVDKIQSDQDFAKSLTDGAFTFGDSMYEVLKTVGDDNRLFRLLVV